HRILLRRLAHCCIATDLQAASIAALLHGHVLLAKNLDDGLELARASWRDAWFRARHAECPAPRELPRPWFGDAPLRVLLQVERLGEGGLEHALAMLVEHLPHRHRAHGVLAVLGDDAPERVAGLEVVHLPARNRAARYRKLLCDERIDVVDALHSTFGHRIARELGVPFVQTLQNTAVWLDAAEREQWLAADEDTAAYLCVSDR